MEVQPSSSLCVSVFSFLKTSGSLAALSMKAPFLLFALLPLVFPTNESDTVACRKNFNICSTLLCPVFYTANGTCYDGKQKCCVPWKIKEMLLPLRKT
uniref:Beta-defensin-like domain-containing protein n=1 Tax=Podarcis muralis TaxID=64176 RepID=A0A670HUT5_PODMU